MNTEKEMNELESEQNSAPISKFQRSANRAQIVPGFIRFGLVALALLVDFYCIFENVGPYYWIVRVQAELFDGSYFTALSFLLSFMLILLPVLVIIRSMIPYYERKRDKNSDILDQL